MKLYVKQSHRYSTQRAHTATHLLHTELDTMIPEGTKQAGSFVGHDTLRFDFTSQSPLTDKQLQTIQYRINQHIEHALPVQVEEMSYTQAQQQGAKAFFEDIYGEKVRVVSIGEQKIISQELCGGTHVHNTKDIGAFVIDTQEAVASGIKRIHAYTGPKTNEIVLKYTNNIKHFQNLLQVKSPTHIEKKIQKLQSDLKTLQHQKQNLEQSLLTSIIQHAPYKPHPLFGQTLRIDDISALSPIPFKTIVIQAKNILTKTTLLYHSRGNFAIIAPDSTHSARELLQQRGAKGGGDDELAQGKTDNIEQKLS